MNIVYVLNVTGMQMYFCEYTSQQQVTLMQKYNIGLSFLQFHLNAQYGPVTFSNFCFSNSDLGNHDGLAFTRLVTEF